MTNIMLYSNANPCKVSLIDKIVWEIKIQGLEKDMHAFARL